jgi:hypothetical protein
MLDDTESLRARLGVLPIVWTSPSGRFTLRCTSERGRVMTCQCCLYGEEPHLAQYTGDAEYATANCSRTSCAPWQSGRRCRTRQGAPPRRGASKQVLCALVEFQWPAQDLSRGAYEVAHCALRATVLGA